MSPIWSCRANTTLCPTTFPASIRSLPRNLCEQQERSETDRVPQEKAGLRARGLGGGRGELSWGADRQRGEHTALTAWPFTGKAAVLTDWASLLRLENWVSAKEELCQKPNSDLMSRAGGPPRGTVLPEDSWVLSLGLHSHHKGGEMRQVGFFWPKSNVLKRKFKSKSPPL